MAPFLDDFAKLLTILSTLSSRLLITGDFNLHIDDLNNTNTIDVLALLETFSLNVSITVPTHLGGQNLNLIIFTGIIIEQSLTVPHTLD